MFVIFIPLFILKISLCFVNVAYFEASVIFRAALLPPTPKIRHYVSANIKNLLEVPHIFILCAIIPDKGPTHFR